MAENIKGIYEISGFGMNTLHEKACQDMLQAGFDWLEDNKDKLKKLEGYTIKNLWGIFIPNNKETQELSQTIIKASYNYFGKIGPIGPIHRAVMNQLFFITKNGIEKWKTEKTTKRTSKMSKTKPIKEIPTCPQYQAEGKPKCIQFLELQTQVKKWLKEDIKRANKQHPGECSHLICIAIRWAKRFDIPIKELC